MLKNFRKVDVKKPAGATPHGRVAFVRFGAESCARIARKKCQNGVAKVLIAGTRPLWRSLFLSLKKLAKKTKIQKIEKGPRARWDSALATSFTEQTRRNPKN